MTIILWRGFGPWYCVECVTPKTVWWSRILFPTLTILWFRTGISVLLEKSAWSWLRSTLTSQYPVSCARRCYDTASVPTLSVAFCSFLWVHSTSLTVMETFLALSQSTELVLENKQGQILGPLLHVLTADEAAGMSIRWREVIAEITTSFEDSQKKIWLFHQNIYRDLLGKTKNVPSWS